MSSGAELHFRRSAVELPHTVVIHDMKQEQRCRRHATKMQLRGKFGQEADRHADRSYVPPVAWVALADLSETDLAAVLVRAGPHEVRAFVPRQVLPLADERFARCHR